MSKSTYIFRRHAVERMAARNITRDDVEFVVRDGEVIREYADDTPYPSRLILGWSENRPLHVVAADDNAANEIYIITVYEPDSEIWDEDFRSRKT